MNKPPGEPQDRKSNHRQTFGGKAMIDPLPEKKAANHNTNQLKTHCREDNIFIHVLLLSQAAPGPGLVFESLPQSLNADVDIIRHRMVLLHAFKSVNGGGIVALFFITN